MAEAQRQASSRVDDLQRFYAALNRLEERLGGKRRLSDCHGRMAWPRRGVYFFFEPGEVRTGSGEGPRVVRVGTHALGEGSGTKLWGRLSQHRGVGSGGGNHRGSIFRLLVGEALLAKSSGTSTSWGLAGTLKEAARRLGREIEDVRAEEAALEQEVSAYIGAMPFLWLDVPDDPGPASQRGLVERNSIALLSGYDGDAADPPSAGWLGQYSSREAVRRSGLWNNNHVRESYDVSSLWSQWMP